MIRVNLIRDVVGGMYSPSPSGVAMDANSAPPVEGAGGQTELIIKFVILLLPVILTYAVRSYMIDVRQNQLRKLQAEQSQLEAKLKSFEPGLKDIEKFQEEKKKLDSQLDVIRKLSKERLKNVKSLDALQGIIPNKAWLTRLKISADNLELEGVATDDIVISDFMKNLGSSIYFANVALESSEETKIDEGTAKKFVIKCSLENL